MRRIILLGNPGSKRTIWFEKAAREQEVPLELLDWKKWDRMLPEGVLFFKIDPPLWESSALEELKELTRAYKEDLSVLACRAEKGSVEFLNEPQAIRMLLDKRRCKKRLMESDLPVTEFLCENDKIQSTDQLLSAMKRQKIWQVFVKPVYGSGAAGVSAFRLQPGTGKMCLYTCALLLPGTGLVNTKKLQSYTRAEEIRSLLDRILGLDCVVERWYPKASHNGYSYDLRAVVQRGQVDYLLARMSRGPITNLHLNNHPLPVEALGLPVLVQERIRTLCQRAMECFPGLQSAGIDLLLEKGSLSPRIIEMNAQGDLIYQDLYDQNQIYRRQAVWMKAWLSKPE